MNLGGTLPCVPSAATACLLDPSLTVGFKSGYSLTAIGGPPVNGVISTYVATASPFTIGSTGDNAFCLTQSGVIRVDPSGVGGQATTAACEALEALQ